MPNKTQTEARRNIFAVVQLRAFNYVLLPSNGHHDHFAYFVPLQALIHFCLGSFDLMCLLALFSTCDLENAIDSQQVKRCDVRLFFH